MIGYIIMSNQIQKISDLNNNIAATIQNNLQQVNQYFRQQNFSNSSINLYESDSIVVAAVPDGNTYSEIKNTILPIKLTYTGSQVIQIPDYLLPYLKVSLIVDTPPEVGVLGITNYIDANIAETFITIGDVFSGPLNDVNVVSFYGPPTEFPTVYNYPSGDPNISGATYKYFQDAYYVKVTHNDHSQNEGFIQYAVDQVDGLNFYIGYVWQFDISESVQFWDGTNFLVGPLNITSVSTSGISANCSYVTTSDGTTVTSITAATHFFQFSNPNVQVGLNGAGPNSIQPTDTINLIERAGYIPFIDSALTYPVAIGFNGFYNPGTYYAPWNSGPSAPYGSINISISPNPTTGISIKPTIYNGNTQNNFTIEKMSNTTAVNEYILTLNDSVVLSSPASQLTDTTFTNYTIVGTWNPLNNPVGYDSVTTTSTQDVILYQSPTVYCNVKYRVDVINPYFSKDNKTYYNNNNTMNTGIKSNG